MNANEDDQNLVQSPGSPSLSIFSLLHSCIQYLSVMLVGWKDHIKIFCFMIQLDF